MKSSVLLLSALLTCVANAAFDSETWLGKRAVFAREAERLKAAYVKYEALVKTPSENVTITLEQFPDGAVKTELFAREAVFFREQHFVWTKGLTIRKRSRDGAEVARIDAENCVVDQTTKSGWCPGHATILREKTRFEGDQVYFSSPESYVAVFANSDLRSSDGKMEGLQ